MTESILEPSKDQLSLWDYKQHKFTGKTRFSFFLAWSLLATETFKSGLLGKTQTTSMDGKKKGSMWDCASDTHF